MMSRGIVRIEFRTDNAAFDEYRNFGIATILNGIAYQIQDLQQTEGVIRDVNGNRIGTWTTNGINE